MGISPISLRGVIPEHFPIKDHCLNIVGFYTLIWRVVEIMAEIHVAKREIGPSVENMVVPYFVDWPAGDDLLAGMGLVQHEKVVIFINRAINLVDWPLRFGVNPLLCVREHTVEVRKGNG